MMCPYCGGEMKQGYLRCDNRAGLMWITEDEKVGWLDREIGRVGQLKATNIGLAIAKTPANYCPACKKMIIDTDIQK